MHMGVDAVMMCIVQRLTVLINAPVMPPTGRKGMLQRSRMILHGGSHSPASAGEDDGDHQEDEKAVQGSLHFLT